MPRLAWFTPLPPAKSGIAKYNQELLPVLAHDHQVDLFVDGRPEEFHPPASNLRVFSAHDFFWRSREQPYDLVVYQLGNAPSHDYMWAYIVRYPGLVVLHDGQLHHARGRMLLQPWNPRQSDYRREFWFNHPDSHADLAYLGSSGLLGSLTYLWPMLRTVIESSRYVLVHNQWLADQIREAHPRTAVDVVEMGVPESAPRMGARQEVRSRHGIAEDAIVFMAFGRVTPEKRIREALRALATIADAPPQVHLLLAGETVDYYDLRADAQALRVDRKVTMAGYVAEADIDDYLAASDVCLSMRWPTSRETSASWLRCLAAGKPTISTDLAHTVDIPTLDPRDWTVLNARLKPRPAVIPTTTVIATDTSAIDADRVDHDVDAQPVGVSIDILDEDHSLSLAMWRLATDARLRATLGGNGRALWQERFRLDHMAAGYARVVRDALATPLPDGAAVAQFPEHLRATGLEHAAHLLSEAGLPAEVLAGLWTRKHD
jgi:glycosyltransferase involved in cell wall biosynthesis